jgi:microcystin-dependent protein
MIKKMRKTVLVICILFSGFASAQDAFVGEIKMFAGTFAPRGYALCNGQLLPISSNQALFSILGTTYGGNGQSTFGLPDLRGRVPVSSGQGPGLTTRTLGSMGGSETNTLGEDQITSHSHSGNGNVVGSNGNKTTATANSPISIWSSGGTQSVNNVQPFTTINYIIALTGVFPSQN